MAAARLQYVNVPKVIEVIPIRKKTTHRILNPKSDPEIGNYLGISAPDYSFGPFYHPESKSSIEAKDKAWKKILEKEGPDEENTIQRYLSAIRRVEKEARAAYGGNAALVDFTESEFRWMMIKDSCLFLQLTLSLLNNASTELDYPDDDPIFGKKQSIKTFMGLIKSMFLVGNQIPLVVLNKLMNLNFFRSIIAGVQRWERPSDLFSKQILYDLIVAPAVQKGQKNPQLSSSSSSLKFLNFARWMACWPIHVEKPTFYTSHRETPSDLLQGLQLFFLGPTVDKKSSSPDESGGVRPDYELHKRDLEAGIKLKKRHNNPNPNPPNILEAEEEEEEEEQSNFKRHFVKIKAIEEELEKNKRLTLSNLTKKGIYIWNNVSKCGGGGGSRAIEFKNRLLWGSLYLPPLKINHETNVLFTNLKYYEIVHKQKEVRSYINFLANLITSYDDVNFLASNKIIDENIEWEDKERFHEMLRKLSDKKKAGSITHRHQSVIGRVRDYSIFPWERFKYVAIFVFVLTILQTVFGILSYIVGKEQLHQQGSAVGSSNGMKFDFP